MVAALSIQRSLAGPQSRRFQAPYAALISVRVSLLIPRIGSMWPVLLRRTTFPLRTLSNCSTILQATAQTRLLPSSIQDRRAVTILFSTPVTLEVTETIRG